MKNLHIKYTSKKTSNVETFYFAKEDELELLIEVYRALDWVPSVREFVDSFRYVEENAGRWHIMYNKKDYMVTMTYFED